MSDLTRAIADRDATIKRLREALVLAAIPHEALVADWESRQWIAPSIWVAMEEAVVAIRAALEAHDE